MTGAAQATQPREAAALLARHEALAGQLEQALAHEARALAARDPEALLEAAQAKETAAAALEAAHGELATLAGDASEATVRAWLARQPDGQLLLARWEALRARLTDLRRRNQSNGLLLELGRRAARQALAILRGEEPVPATYGREPGAGKVPGTGRSLGRG